MAAVSRRIIGNAKDVLAGTVVGTLPTDAPSYDVEIQIATDETNASKNATLLVNGVAALQNAWIHQYDQVVRIAGDQVPEGPRVLIYTGPMAPRSDAPTTFFNAPAGSRLTLNLAGLSETAITNVYVEARQSANASSELALAHIAAIDLSSTLNRQDILTGTPVGKIPTNNQLYSVAIQPAVVVPPSATETQINAAQDLTITMLLDSDTICENFLVPVRSALQWPVDERDTLITTLAAGGSRLTLNAFKPTVVAPTASPDPDPGQITYFVYKAYVVAVA